MLSKLVILSNFFQRQKQKTASLKRRIAVWAKREAKTNDKATLNIQKQEPHLNVSNKLSVFRMPAEILVAKMNAAHHITTSQANNTSNSRGTMNIKECSSTDLICEELIELVQAYSTRLSVLDEQTIKKKRTPDSWSVQQVVGHMIDSAANNHQRFVRAQKGESLTFPQYDQNHWVNVQNFDACSWQQLIEFWKLYNMHLAHLIRQIPDSQMRTKCTITPNDPVSLSFLIEDYLAHLKHHLNKINERVSL